MYVALLLYVDIYIHKHIPHIRQFCQQHGTSSSRVGCRPWQPRCFLDFAREKCLLCGMKSLVLFFIFARPCSESVVMPRPLARVCGLYCFVNFLDSNVLLGPNSGNFMCWYRTEFFSLVMHIYVLISSRIRATTKDPLSVNTMCETRLARSSIPRCSFVCLQSS